MDDLISRLSEIRSEYNCFDENEESYYRALSEAIKILSRRENKDTISRQAAINAECEVCQIATKRERGHNCNYYVHGCKEIECLRALPSAQQEPQWIPCSERLPKKSGRYLVTRGLNACGSLWNRIYIANYSDLMGIKSERIWWQGNVGKSDFERLDDVIAWMSLPEPYEP